jgi:hypothetical protein
LVKFGPTGILSIVALVLGVSFFIGAVSGLLFARPTPITDIGLFSVTLTFLALGGFGLWAAIAEDKQRESL